MGWKSATPLLMVFCTGPKALSVKDTVYRLKQSGSTLHEVGKTLSFLAQILPEKWLGSGKTVSVWFILWVSFFPMVMACTISAGMFGSGAGTGMVIIPKTSNQPLGPALGEQKIRRGGAWFNGPEDIRVNTRLRKDPGARYGILGFRLVRTAPQAPEGWVGLKPWEQAVDAMSPEVPEEQPTEQPETPNTEDSAQENELPPEEIEASEERVIRRGQAS